LNNDNQNHDPLLEGIEKQGKSAFDLNLKRVLARMIRFWYVIVLSMLAALAVAYLINRYTTRVYPVRASIIIRESEENAGAKFLYNNELISPYRNFYNELYIMRSYPLLQKVVEELSFDVSYYRVGNIKTTEFYENDFPIQIKPVKGAKLPFGRSLNLEIHHDLSFSLELLFDEEKAHNQKFENLHFHDTVRVNGYAFTVAANGDVSKFKDELFLVRFNDPFQVARSYSAKLIANWAQLGASVVNLEVNGPVIQKEVDFLNKFIEKYQEYDVEKKNKVATMAIGFLDQQLIVIGDSLELYEDKVESFKHKNVITNLDDETKRLYERVIKLEEEKFNFKLGENYYDYIIQLLSRENYEGIFTPSSVGVDDPVVAALIKSLLDVRTQMNMYQGVARPRDNPIYQEQYVRLQQIKKDILRTIENTRKTESIHIKFIDDQIKTVESQLNKLPKTETELIGIQRNYALKENLYVYLLQKRTEAGLSKASTTSDIVVVNPPLAGVSVTPKVAQNYGIAAGLGFLIPVLLFVFIELLNDRIQSKEDIEKITGVPLIGGIGHNPSENSLIVLNKPRSAMAESFRSLRSNLNYFTGNRIHQVFMVTSSIPREGKSFTTLNLASVLALAGKKTVIVGADLRKPKLFDELNLNNDTGLSQYLSGMATYEEILQKSKIENLYLISGGPMPPNPSELLIRPGMKTLMDELRKDFDFVVIDTPPLSFVTDAFVLAEYADHTLFVIRQDYTPRPALQSLQEFYATGKLAKISILFNDLRKSGLGYGYDYGSYGYGYGYGYGYSYGIDKKKTAADTAGYYSE
jgi:capsular exopolysaccharide synthesis family protein